MWSSPIGGLFSNATGCADERDENELEGAKREVGAYRARVKELNQQIKEERQKTADRIRTLEIKVNSDIASGITDKQRKSSDLGSTGSDEITGLRKKVDQLMLIKAASEFRILELEGKAKKYKARVAILIRERNDNVSIVGSVATPSSLRIDDDDEFYETNNGGGEGAVHSGLDSEAEVATLVLSRIRQLNGQVDEVRSELALMTKERDTLQGIRGELEAFSTAMENKIPALEEEVVLFNALLDQERIKIQDMKKTILLEKEEVTKAQASHAEVEQKMAENTAMFEVFKKERDEFAEQTSDMESTLNQIRSETKSITADSKVGQSTLNKQLSVAFEEREKLQMERKSAMAEMKTCREEAKTLSTSIAELEKQVVDKDSELVGLKADCESITANRNTVQGMLELTQKELTMLKAKINTLEIEISSKQAKTDLSTATAAATAKDKADMEAIRSKNTLLKQRIDDAGKEKKKTEEQLAAAEKRHRAVVDEIEQLRAKLAAAEKTAAAAAAITAAAASKRVDVSPPPPPPQQPASSSAAPTAAPAPAPTPTPVPAPVPAPAPVSLPTGSVATPPTLPTATRPVSELDRQRLEDLKQVNNALLQFIIDPAVRDSMTLPTVHLALAHWAGKAANITPEQTQQTQLCPGVITVYPKVKQLEEICNRVKVKLPLDHVMEGKTRLDNTSLIAWHGPEFCVTHGLLG